MGWAVTVTVAGEGGRTNDENKAILAADGRIHSGWQW
jgi:hypothetical protein